MATEDVQTNLRIPADLKERLSVAADEANRSLSAEVSLRLARSFEVSGSDLSRTVAALNHELMARDHEVEHLRSLLQMCHDEIRNLLAVLEEAGITLPSPEGADLIELLRVVREELASTAFVEELLDKVDMLNAEAEVLRERIEQLGRTPSPDFIAKLDSTRDLVRHMRSEIAARRGAEPTSGEPQAKAEKPVKVTVVSTTHVARAPAGKAGKARR